jgi:hypothetical protein
MLEVGSYEVDQIKLKVYTRSIKRHCEQKTRGNNTLLRTSWEADSSTAG